MKIRYSRHARNRLRLYKIAEEEVERLLKEGKIQPDPKSQSESGFFSTLKLGEKVFKVAFSRENDNIFVKTVYPLRKEQGGR